MHEKSFMLREVMYMIDFFYHLHGGDFPFHCFPSVMAYQVSPWILFWVLGVEIVQGTHSTLVMSLAFPSAPGTEWPVCVRWGNG